MRIALVGFGSVGRSFATLLEARREQLYRDMGLSPRLVLACDSRTIARNDKCLLAADLIASKHTTGSVGTEAIRDLPHLLRDVRADVVVEASPSVLANPGPAFDNMKGAMSGGKHVISVNKAPLAVAMPALLDLAKFNKVQLRFSGTVGAGTPVLATARTLALGDQILKIRGILNGTTNFILWRMLDRHELFAAALAEAIRLGYAETDPSADIDGIDTQAKVTILANAVLGLGVTVRDVQVRGIRDMSLDQVSDAARRGMSLKLIGEIDAVSRSVSVSPQEVPRFGAMDVPEALNAVQFVLASAGEVTLVGRGAGGPETATAIIRDLVDIWNTLAH